ncbi:MAG: class I SAM-dependent methyltransferase [Planctomycetota bacterium]
MHAGISPLPGSNDPIRSELCHAGRPWYETAFGADYAARYAHRDDAQAEAEIHFLLTTLQLPADARVLDLCCGSGRHLRVMLTHGLKAEGLDLSADLLALALADGLPVTRADMRAIPHPTGQFAAVFNLFTSFGYFDDAENRGALNEMARVLAPGGRLVLDVLNPVATLTTLAPRSEKAIRWCTETESGEAPGAGGAGRAARLIELRRYDPVARRLAKIVQVWSPDGTRAHKEYLESVRVYFADEWPALLAGAGLRPVAMYGTLEGRRFEELTSPRQVVLAEKPV